MLLPIPRHPTIQLNLFPVFRRRPLVIYDLADLLVGVRLKLLFVLVWVLLSVFVGVDWGWLSLFIAISLPERPLVSSLGHLLILVNIVLPVDGHRFSLKL